MPISARCRDYGLTMRKAFGHAVAGTERVGFEPTRRNDPPTRFPVAHLKPLGHLSGAGMTIAGAGPSSGAGCGVAGPGAAPASARQRCPRQLPERRERWLRVVARIEEAGVGAPAAAGEVGGRVAPAEPAD